MSSELRQPECSYDEDHCHAFCGTSQRGEAKGSMKKAVGTLDASAAEASSILQAIRLVSQVPSTKYKAGKPSSSSLLPQVLSNQACKYMCSRCYVHRRQGKSLDINIKGISDSDEL